MPRGTMDARTLLMILALGDRDIEEGKTTPVSEVARRLRGRGKSPSWHGDVLAGREAAIRDGEEHFEDWDTAKRKIMEDLP